MRKKLLLVLLNLCCIVPVLSHLLNVPQSHMAAAAGPEKIVIVKPSLAVQAMSAAEVNQRTFQPLGEPFAPFKHATLNYRLNHPMNWQLHQAETSSVAMQSADGETQLTIKTVTPSADELADFVLQQVQAEIVLTRQSLIINGYPAEQVTTYSDEIAGQRLYIFIDTGQAIHVVQGTGNRLMIETVARSLETM